MNIRDVLKPGDILNAGGTDLPKPFFQRLARWIVIEGIHKAQKRVFGAKSVYTEHHTMIYFGEDKVFSVELPRPKYISLKQYDTSLDTLSVYRFSKFDLDSEDVKVMTGVADRIIAEKKRYDIGQLTDMLVGVISGYSFDSLKVFDFGRKNMVCSVGVATIYNAWRKWRKMQNRPVCRLFQYLNTASWPTEFVNDFTAHGRWDIESTMPACFSNTSTHFMGELKFIGKFRNGIQTKD